jgi:hypothetical protein
MSIANISGSLVPLVQTQALQVISDPLPASGDVLTSDSKGNATWQAPAGGGVTSVTNAQGTNFAVAGSVLTGGMQQDLSTTGTPTFTSLNGNTFYAPGCASVVQLGVRGGIGVNTSTALNLTSAMSGNTIGIRSNIANLTINLPVVGFTEGWGSWFQFVVQLAGTTRTITINSRINAASVTPPFQGNVIVCNPDGVTANTSLFFDGTKTILTLTSKSRGDQLLIFCGPSFDVWYISGTIGSASILVAS